MSIHILSQELHRNSHKTSTILQYPWSHHNGYLEYVLLVDLMANVSYWKVLQERHADAKIVHLHSIAYLQAVFASHRTQKSSSI